MQSLPDLDTLEKVSSLALTAMSTIVAGTAVLVARTQNIGWPPFLLVGKSSLKVGPRAARSLELYAEFWNRRRHPVVVRQLTVRVSGIELAPDKHTARSGGGMHRSGSRYWQELDQVVEPGGHLPLPISVEIADQSLDAARPEFDLSVTITDPVKRGFSTCRLTHRFFEGELGWKLDKKGRSAAVAAYANIRANMSQADDHEPTSQA